MERFGHPLPPIDSFLGDQEECQQKAEQIVALPQKRVETPNLQWIIAAQQNRWIWMEEDRISGDSAVFRTNNGQKQLWAFILEYLLENGNNADSCVGWTRRNRFEFVFRRPAEFAKLWGKEKNRPNMNYDKMSRSLRYYYMKKVVEKTKGERFVYRFCADMKQMCEVAGLPFPDGL